MENFIPKWIGVNIYYYLRDKRNRR